MAGNNDFDGVIRINNSSDPLDDPEHIRTLPPEAQAVAWKYYFLRFRYGMRDVQESFARLAVVIQKNLDTDIETFRSIANILSRYLFRRRRGRPTGTGVFSSREEFLEEAAKHVRGKSGRITQKWLARVMGVSRRTLQRYLSPEDWERLR